MKAYVIKHGENQYLYWNTLFEEWDTCDKFHGAQILFTKERAQSVAVVQQSKFPDILSVCEWEIVERVL